MTSMLLLSLAARAAEIDVLPLTENFGAGDLAGRDGWVAGYNLDGWPVTANGDDVVPETDDAANVNDTVWGIGDEKDNWLTQEGIVAIGEGGVEASFQNLGQDAIGLVYSLGGDDGYIAFWSASNVPPPVKESGQQKVYVLRISNGVATPIGQLGTAIFDFGAVDYKMRIERNDDHVIVTFAGLVVTDYVDATPIANGYAGFYSYTNGGALDDPASAFESIRIFQHDDDADLVADDADNCEIVANVDQADDDGDDVGNACDPDYVPPVTGTDGDADTDTDTDTDVDADTDSDADTDEPDDTDDTDSDVVDPAGDGEILVVGKGCSSTGRNPWTHGAALGLGLLAARLVRRRWAGSARNG